MPPTVLKTEATVLRIRSFANTSHIVTWLSADCGRMTTVVKGACRPKSAFLGQYDLFQTCELLYYAHARDGLHIARECAPLRRRDALRDDWRGALCASYACDLVDRIAEEAPQGGVLHAPTTALLDALAEGAAGRPLLLWFEARLLELIGLSPDLEGCPHCRAAAQDAPRFFIAAGRVVCERCHTRTDAAPALTIPRGHLAALRAAARRPAPAPHLFATLGDNALTVLRRFLGVFLRYHLDLPLAGRGIAWDALGPAPAPAPAPPPRTTQPELGQVAAPVAAAADVRVSEAATA